LEEGTEERKKKEGIRGGRGKIRRRDEDAGKATQIEN
jgi:hypothetical protein